MAQQIRVEYARAVYLAAFWVFDLKDQEKTWNLTFDNDRAYMLEMTAKHRPRRRRSARPRRSVFRRQRLLLQLRRKTRRAADRGSASGLAGGSSTTPRRHVGTHAPGRTRPPRRIADLPSHRPEARELPAGSVQPSFATAISRVGRRKRSDPPRRTPARDERDVWLYYPSVPERHFAGSALLASAMVPAGAAASDGGRNQEPWVLVCTALSLTTAVSG